MRFFACLLLLSGCGGVTVLEEDGGSGQGAGTPGTTGAGQTTIGSTVAGTTGGAPCSSHEQCPDGFVCVFSQSTCAPACDDVCSTCGPGSVCDTCATSSCPQCADCKAACVPAAPGRCDEDDACPLDEVCLFERQACAPSCESDGCADPNMICDGCASGSCCGCKDCVSACTQIPP